MQGARPHLVAEYGVTRIGVFSSYVKGLANETSDVDVIVEFERLLGSGSWSSWSIHERLLGREEPIEGIERAIP
ncbi:MAG: nucleotidyltransferase domain-containing protein [Candidatus Brachytrichaceae bacterium NZ_4S206]|jgi:predicted nucleotidyltransferase